MFEREFVTCRKTYAEAIRTHVRVDQEFNLYTNGRDELRSVVSEVASCCGEVTIIKECFGEVQYEIPWYCFNLMLLETGIALFPKEEIRQIKPMSYKGNPVWKIEICAPR